MRRWMLALCVSLLAACDSSNGGGGGAGDDGRCVTQDECSLPTPLFAEGRCVACTETAHCTAERPFCLEGACWGRDCQDDAGCSEEKPICDLGICVACAGNRDCDAGEVCSAAGSCGPCTADGQCDAGQICEGGSCVEMQPLADVVFVVDRSGSMQICAAGGAGEGSCDSDGDGSLDATGASRWGVVRAVLADTSWMAPAQKVGLVVAGVGGDDASCGAPALFVSPGSSPDALAAELLGAAGSETRVVLVTDGPMNCNVDHAMPCTCASEYGCPSADGGAPIAFREEGNLLDGRFCLDADAGVEAVQQLRAGGVRTAVVSVTATDDALAGMGWVAAAGGLVSGHPSGIHLAGDEASLLQAVQDVLSAE
ncbi:hypothetical protein [Vulgatibacter sp.]|uniref:hypothetical protein n=1 Tax=Vulgatibacter sp. TaxID=1971226 RepID=UPI003566B54D